MDSGHSHPSSQAAFHRSTPLPPPDDVSTLPSRQQRLLRARNARFSAKRISISGISARFSDMIKTNEDKGRAQPTGKRNQENASSNKRKTPEPDAHSASSLGILGEISDSASAEVRSHQKRAYIPIFQDTIEGSLSQHSPYPSPTVYQDASSPTCSQPTTSDSLHDSFTAMALKEISGNARKSPATVTSPYNSGLTGVTRRPASFHASRFNPEQYIEHLEKHLELVKNDAYSPESNRPWKEKLNTADAEKERLKSEAQQMKAAFEVELQKTVEHMTATEVELRRKILSMEDELEQKNLTIQELEMQHEERRLDQSTVDTLRSTIDKLEQEKRSLEQCNDSISKRNEVLTQLLAISPTKTQGPLKLSSPVRLGHKARPRSLMIPRIPSSPDAMASTSPAPSATAFSPRRAPRSATTPFPPSYDATLGSATGGDASLDFGIGDSDYVVPPSRVNSCRSPTASQPSTSPTSCTPPLDASINQDPSRPHSKHRARRFVQGLTQLKPLLLPSLMGENGALREALPLTPPRRQPRTFSENSMDPAAMLRPQFPTPTKTFAFHAASVPPDNAIEKSQPQCFESTSKRLSDPVNAIEDKNELDCSPVWSYSLISEQLDNAVHRKLDSLMSPTSSCIDARISRPRSQSPDEEAEKTILPDKPGLDADAVRRSYPYQPSLNCESSPDLSSPVEVPLPLFSPSVWQGTSQRLVRSHRNVHNETGHLSEDEMENVFGTELATPCQKRRKVRSSSLVLDSGEPLGSHQSSQENNLDPATPITPSQQMKTEESQTIASVPRSPPTSSSPLIQPQNPMEVLYKGGMARSLTAVTLKAICGAWSKYMKYFAVIRRDPLALARRVIANAWHAKWTFCGMMSWWVLGLFLGPFWRRSQPLSWDDYDAQHIAEREVQSHGVETCSNTEDGRSSGDTDPVPTRKPPLKMNPPCWTQSLLLWGKFSIAIMMAVGGAVVQGPAEMLREADERSTRCPRMKAQRINTPCQDNNMPLEGHPSQTRQTRTQQVPGGFEIHSDDVGGQTEVTGMQHYQLTREDSDFPCSVARPCFGGHDLANPHPLPSSFAHDYSPLATPSPSGTESDRIVTLDLPEINPDCSDLAAFEPGELSAPSREGLHCVSEAHDPELGPSLVGLGIFIPKNEESCALGGSQELPLPGETVECDNIHDY